MNHKIHQSLDKWVIIKYLENFTQELHIYIFTVFYTITFPKSAPNVLILNMV